MREETIPVPEAAPAVSSPKAAPMDSREESIPVRGVRKATATAMTSSAYTAPHVSVWVDVDASRTMELVKRLKTSPDFADVKVSRYRQKPPHPLDLGSLQAEGKRRRLEIVERLERGEVTAQEAIGLLKGLES